MIIINILRKEKKRKEKKRKEKKRKEKGENEDEKEEEHDWLFQCAVRSGRNIMSCHVMSCHHLSHDSLTKP
jgi:hypothetical protein